MRKSVAICLAGAAIAAMSVAPASAQRATSNTSWEGASHEMQVRGPRSNIYGPDRGGRLHVTGTRGWGGRLAWGPRHYRHHRHVYGMGRW
jgi:hypothetical protein